MAVMNRSGLGAELPIGTPKGRGRVLSNDRARRLRDLLLVLLVRVMRLSVPDAIAVLKSGSISRRHADRILDACPLGPMAVVRKLRGLFVGGDSHAE